MRDIEGIEVAMAVLQPHWKEIEEDFNRQNDRFLALAKTDHDAVGRVLRAHLIIENFMNTFIPAFYGLRDFDDLGLSFSQKAKLLPRQGVPAAFVRPGIIQLNSVRNKYGHTLDYDVNFNKIGSIMSVLQVARSEAHFKTPIDAIEAFAPVACAFLSLPPKHLEQAFSNAFRHLYSATPDED